VTEDPRISEIRAIAGEWRNAGLTDLDAMRRVCAILDRPAPAPRVWFPGDTVPAGVVVVIPHANDGYSCYFGPLHIGPSDGYAIELPIPTAAGRQAAVDLARAEREEADRG
jgi:hypothetical protein